MKTLGWHDEKSGASVYRGEWMRLTVHRIHGLRDDEWFLTCHSLNMDTLRLQATTLPEARVEALQLAWRMRRRYGQDLVQARRGAEGLRKAAAATTVGEP